MALRCAVTRLLSTSQKSVAVTAARAQGTAVAASRGAFEINCIIQLQSIVRLSDCSENND